jgi:LysM repeat protein
MRGRERLARYAAPAAFLVAATIAILIVRAGLSDEQAAPPTTSAATTTVEGPARTTTAAGTTTAASGAEFYEIEAGDTLAVVADRFDTTVEQLLVLNPDIDPVALTIGQRIRVK